MAGREVFVAERRVFVAVRGVLVAVTEVLSMRGLVDVLWLMMEKGLLPAMLLAGKRVLLEVRGVSVTEVEGRGMLVLRRMLLLSVRVMLLLVSVSGDGETGMQLGMVSGGLVIDS